MISIWAKEDAKAVANPTIQGWVPEMVEGTDSDVILKTTVLEDTKNDPMVRGVSDVSSASSVVPSSL